MNMGRLRVEGFDAIHLSALKFLKNRDNNITVAFSCFDKELNRAAALEGFTVLTT